MSKTFLQVLENRAADAEGKVKVVDINKVEISIDTIASLTIIRFFLYFLYCC